MNARFAGLFVLSAVFIVGATASGRAQSSVIAEQPSAKYRSVSRPAPGIRATPLLPRAQVPVPITNSNSPLGSALAHQCSTENESGELVLPGAKGEIKLDRCYRGRDQLACEFNFLKTEAKSLIEKYRRIIETNYPQVQDIASMCSIQSDSLTNDLQNAREFAERFGALKSEYGSRLACAARVEESLKGVALTDLSQAPNLLKSILDSMDSEMKEVSDLQTQISEFAEKMSLSQRAIATLSKVHRAVCMTSAPARQSRND
jgi:hypothetical protein